MKKVLEFVNLGGTWFYWDPEYDGFYEGLEVIGYFDFILSSIDNKYVKLQVVDKPVATIILSKKEDSEGGSVYICRSKYYNGEIFLDESIVSKEAPQIIYLSEL